MTIEVTLPWPDAHLSQNARGHWALTARRVAAARALAGWKARAAGCRILPPQTLPVTITLYPPDNRRRDRHNAQAAMKAYIDGIADVIGVDDFHWRIEWAWGEVRPDGAAVVELRPVAVNVELRGVIK